MKRPILCDIIKESQLIYKVRVHLGHLNLNFFKALPSNVTTAMPLKCGVSDSVSVAALNAWQRNTLYT